MTTDNQKIVTLSQYPTPAWAAAAIVRKKHGNLTARDYVVEPTCGRGRFLQAIPSYVPAVGYEIDPVEAQLARDLTGRRVITGDIFDAVFELSLIHI